jgi:hypothetical protein
MAGMTKWCIKRSAGRMPEQPQQRDHPIGPTRPRRIDRRQPLDRGRSPASPIAAPPAAKPQRQGYAYALNRQIL